MILKVIGFDYIKLEFLKNIVISGNLKKGEGRFENGVGNKERADKSLNFSGTCSGLACSELV